MAAAEYPSLIGPTRDLLTANFGRPVGDRERAGAELRPDIRLCGCQFGLTLPGIGYLKRERWFETSWRGFYLEASHNHRPRHLDCRARHPRVDARQDRAHRRSRMAPGHGDQLDDPRGTNRGFASRLCEFIGGRLLEHLASEAAA